MVVFSMFPLLLQADTTVQWVNAHKSNGIGYGDLNAYYPQLYFDVDPTAFDFNNVEMVIQGEYSKVRYFSFNAYDWQGRFISGIHDALIEPDNGSINPFEPWADWNASNRNYTVIVRFHDKPVSGPEPNTIYVGRDSNNNPNPLARIAYRVYLPSDGEPVGRDMYKPQVFFRNISTQATIDVPNIFYDSQREAGFSAEPNEPLIADTSECESASGNSLTWSRSPNAALHSENPDTVYIFARLGKVLLVRFKAPVTPETYYNIGISGDEDMRYWSMSINGKIIRTKLSLADEGPGGFVIANDGYANLVLGWGRRPAAAVPENGYTWVDLSEFTFFEYDALVLRHMLPHPGFAFSAREVPAGELVGDLMGEYLPIGSYVRANQL